MLGSNTLTLDALKLLLIDPMAIQQWVFLDGELIFSPKNSALNSLNFSVDLETNARQERELCFTVDKAIEEPIYITQFISSDSSKTMPSLKIHLGEHARASMIEMVCRLATTSNSIGYQSNTKTLIELASNAALNHLFLQNTQELLLSNSALSSLNSALSTHTPKDPMHSAKIVVQQAKQSVYKTNVFALGKGCNHATFEIHSNDKHTESEFYALALGKKQEISQIHLLMQHHQPQSESHTMVRTVMKDEAKGTFVGTIKVNEGAFKTKANLENKNLLLSSLAEANSNPQLEIYNDDVQCSHGATVGHLEQEAIFYLRSRGIPEVDAIQLLIDGFIQPALKGIQQNMPEKLVKKLQGLIAEYYHG